MLNAKTGDEHAFRVLNTTIYFFRGASKPVFSRFRSTSYFYFVFVFIPVFVCVLVFFFGDVVESFNLKNSTRSSRAKKVARVLRL